MSRLRTFREPRNLRAAGELALTLALFVACWSAMLFLSAYHYGLVLLLAVPTAALLVRLFIIQHDCGHGAMFSSRTANDWTGRLLGVVTLTPYDMWRYSHARHHASSGDLDGRGMGDITTLTVREYRELTPLRKLAYRMYRHPIVMFVIGPAYLFVCQHRLPVGAMTSGVMPWASTMGTNAGILAVSAVLIWAFGWWAFLGVHLPVVLLGASIGVWLFYVQHQFEETSWEKEPDWSHPDAALHGSSFYDLPQPLMWVTGNIGIHHLHHLNSRIPFYRLPEALRAWPELKDIGRLTLWQSFGCVRLGLWDEDSRRLVPIAVGGQGQIASRGEPA
jgi:omega-6 fatty acid desaturase (delta-12 desaturase)